ncbi:MAG: hypothetical protein C0506_15905 [Anaerolinea sp.]|nr:hypothetical protein [Anaerolinea sp.]
MTARWYRPLMAVVAVSMALAGGLSLLFSNSAHVVASGSYTIEVNEEGFNPKLCLISRGDVVQWKNVGKKVHRVIKPDAGVGSPPLFDSEDIAPGQISQSFIMTYGGNFNYLDQYNPSLTGTVNTPQRSNTQAENCSPLAPTPTPTPTRTPGPTPTPSPQVAALPMYCRAASLGAAIGNEGCAVTVGIARDD